MDSSRLWAFVVSNRAWSAPRRRPSQPINRDEDPRGSRDKQQHPCRQGELQIGQVRFRCAVPETSVQFLTQFGSRERRHRHPFLPAPWFLFRAVEATADQQVDIESALPNRIARCPATST